MKVLKVKLLLACALVLLIGAAPVALGDWDPGDPNKMHYPQLPDPCGWDVAFYESFMFIDPVELADDWLCTGTGPVSDIHFWVSWLSDMLGDVTLVHVKIYSNDPCGINGYSEPNELLWERTFQDGEFFEDWYGSGEQGWFNPVDDYWNYPDHYEYFQINIEDINDPFIQQEDEIYWLSIEVDTIDAGWKTSQYHWNDDAVFRCPGIGLPEWQELRDPCTGESLDFAFVITGGEEEEVVKWEQPPCLDDPNCMDVDATEDNWMWWAPQALADDFLCTTTGLITDIHIWSSWLYDEPPDYDPNHVWFTLCLYSNDPCGAMGWSEPNELLWTKEFHEGKFDVEIFSEGPEAYYIPCTGDYWPFNHWTCWLYSFYIDPCEAFVQEEGTIYWLALQAHIYDPDPMWMYRFGWKNSSEQWNDDAVWAVGWLPDPLGPWNELLHPMTGESVDLAFKITTKAPPPPPPANDDCNDAEPVGDVTDLPFDTTSATFDGSGTCMYSPNIWYCYTATCTGVVTVSLCGSSYDTMLAVYDGCTCDPLGTQLGCNDDYCGLQSEISFVATAGSEYLIEVGGYALNTGQGLLTISCEPFKNLKWSQPPIEMSQPTGLLYGSSPWMGSMSLSTVNPSTGLVTIIGPFAGAPSSITEIEWSPDGSTLYATTGGGLSTIHTIDPTTGAVLSTVAQIPAGTALQGLEFDASGALLAASWPDVNGQSELVQVNPATGVLTTIGATGFNQIGGLAFDSGFNTLYGITSGWTVPPILLSVNPSTGAAAQIAVTTMTAEASSLEFTADGRLVTAGNDSNFYEINPTTGVATLIGPLVNEPKLSGLSLRPTTPPVYCGWNEASHREIITFECWGPNYPRQCHGDADGLSMGPYWVSMVDLVILKDAFGTSYPDPRYNPCADFDRNLIVDPYDLLIFKTYFNQFIVPPDCMPWVGGTLPGPGTEYYDLFAVSLTPDGNYWDLVNGGAGSEDDPLVSPDPAGSHVVGPNLGGVVWGFGGLDWGDGILDTDASSYSITLMGEPNYYLSVVLDTSTTPQHDETFPSWGTISNIVVTPLDANGDPCFAPVEPNWVKSLFAPIGETLVTQGVSSSVTLANNDFNEDEMMGEQQIGIWGAAAKLPELPPDACGYKVTFDTNVFTWDSYDAVGPVPPALSWEIVADDFRCLGTMPITSIRWWGSYIGWDNPGPPPVEPDAWRIMFWSNVPAGIFAPYSYPEELLWQIEVRATRVEVKNVGQDNFPEKPSDTCFEYYVELLRDECFWQGKFLDQTDDDTFWISIAPLYPLGSPFVDYPWGWKTRPWSWMDDAVVVSLPGEPFQGIVLPPMLSTPIEYAGESYDVCFELDTDPRWIKWQQPFTGIRNWPHYEDEESWATIDVMGEPNIVRLVADDWPCDTNGAVSAIVWWGSYIGYTYEACQGPLMPPYKPNHFLLNIWTDVPATQHAKWTQKPDLTDINGIDVDAVHWYSDPWGWQVLADDFLCTTTEPITDIYIWGSWLDDELPPGGPNDVEFWVEIFSDNPVGPNGWSVPDDMLWWRDFWPGDFEVSRYADDLLEGYYSPYTGFYQPIGDTNCWLYHFHIDPCDAFIQQGDPCDPNVYWLVIQALPQTSDPNVRFGWKTSTDHHRDDAVWKEWWSGSSGPWIELRYPPGHPFAGQTIDLAFEINPGEGPSYSHPNDIIWEYRAYDYDEVLVGYDKHPSGEPNEPVFRYSVRLPEEERFHQEKADGVYWLSVVAVYEDVPDYPWGWTNHRHVYNDDAVAGTLDPNGQWIWEELFDQTETSEDMSFMLFSECMNSSHPRYADWFNWNKPHCWCYEWQCRGDADGLPMGPYRVGAADLALFRSAYLKNNAVLATIPNGICADLDHVPMGPYRVGAADLAIFRNYYLKPGILVPPCDGTHINFWTN